MTMMSMRDIAPRTGGGSRVPAVFRDEPASLVAALRQEVDRRFDEAAQAEQRAKRIPVNAGAAAA